MIHSGATEAMASGKKGKKETKDNSKKI